MRPYCSGEAIPAAGDLVHSGIRGCGKPEGKGNSLGAGGNERTGRNVGGQGLFRDR